MLRSKRSRLPFPATPALRAAQITTGKIFSGVREFPPEDWRDLERFKPRLLVGSASELQKLAEHMQARGVELGSVDHAVFVLTSAGNLPLSDVLRVVLWQTFAVPVYELFVAPNNCLAAFECEAHDGWHIERGFTLDLSSRELVLNGGGTKNWRTGLIGEIAKGRCPCGLTGHRVIKLQKRNQDSGLPERSRFPYAAIA